MSFYEITFGRRPLVEKSNFVKRRWQDEESFWNKETMGMFFCKLWPGKTSGFHVRYRFKVIPWRATGESPFEYVDVYKYTQEIRRNVWKLRMKRWMMKDLTRLGLKFSSKKMSPAKSTYQVCCIPYSNKFASIWRENVSHINAGVKETKTVIWRLHCSSYNFRDILVWWSSEQYNYI